jgi:ribonuclease BN (tRNA processing enzyme)
MPRPGGACSSYLVQTSDAAVLLDIGSGASGKLQLAIEYARLSAIVISHMHADHFFDLVPLRYGLKYGPSSSIRRLPLWLPPGGRTALDALTRAVAVDAPDDFFDEFFEVRHYEPESGLAVGSLHLRFGKTRHYVDAFAVRAQCGPASVIYSADSAPCDALVELARESSLFLCEAGLGLGDEPGRRGHSSAQEAGEMARAARAERLLLTHYPAACAPDSLVEAARRHFSGFVEAAQDGMEMLL